MVVGLLHPGEMGAEVGRCLTGRGLTGRGLTGRGLTGRGLAVAWASAGRSRDSAGRARAAGLRDAGTAAELAARTDVILSVCPPHAALDVARSVAGFRGLYVDANAVSPGTAREVASVIERGGGSYVDGGIIGLPPRAPGSTRLYLSGGRAAEVSELFAGTDLEARVLDGEFAASAIKLAYASWTKGSAALLLAARAFAKAEGVEEGLLAEWELSQPGLAKRWEGAERSAAKKGWRWVAEMEEIASAMTSAGLPGGFHLAAAEIYRRSPRPAAPGGPRPGDPAQE
jgi:3-hydroxyisobutyrate dehydrogenase-like beta-hydroxyacid dehydrogenase